MLVKIISLKISTHHNLQPFDLIVLKKQFHVEILSVRRKKYYFLLAVEKPLQFYLNEIKNSVVKRANKKHEMLV